MPKRYESRVDRVIELSTEIKASETRLNELKVQLNKLIGPSPNTHPRGKAVKKSKGKGKRQRMSRADAARIPSLILRFLKKKKTEVAARDIVSSLKISKSNFFRAVNQLIKQKEVVKIRVGVYEATR